MGFVRSFFRPCHAIHNMEWILKFTCQFSHILPAKVKIFRLFFRFFDIFLSKSIAFLNAVVYNIVWSKSTVRNIRQKPERSASEITYSKEEVLYHEKETYDGRIRRYKRARGKARLFDCRIQKCRRQSHACSSGRTGYLRISPHRGEKKIAEGLGLSLSEVYGAVSFYSQFALNPKGKVAISVCLGTACYVKGSGKLHEKCMEITGIGAGDISPDGRFSYEATRCIGACGLAPVMTVNGDVYGRITPADVEGIIAKYL